MSPPPDVGSGAGAGAAPPARETTLTPERGAASPNGPVAALDHADIRPLNVPGALHILIAEVRAALASALEVDLGTGGGAGGTADLDDPAAAARVIVDLVLASLPEAFEPWSVAMPRADAALQAAVQSAARVVGAWRDVSPAVIDAAGEAGILALRVIAEDLPAYPPWPPPEWLGMTPRLARFWRRRRLLGRRLSDPDPEIRRDPESRATGDDPDEID